MARTRDRFVFALFPLAVAGILAGCSSSTVVSAKGAAGGAGGSAGNGGAGGTSSAAACPGALLELSGSPLSASAHGDLYTYPAIGAGSCVSDQNDKQTAIYHFVAPKPGVVTLEAQSTSFGPAVYIWKACDDPFSEIGCWEKGKGNAAVEANKDYYVFVTTGWKMNASSLFTLGISYN